MRLPRINLDRVLKFRTGFMRKLATKVIKLIIDDARQGIFQNEASNLQYLSSKYKKYKQNSMRRLGYDWNDKVEESFGRNAKNVQIKEVRGKQIVVGARVSKKGKAIKNQKLKGFGNKSVNTNVNFVDMWLTGDLYKDLKVGEAEPNRVTIGVSQEESVKKLIGNERFGRDMMGANKKNLEIITQDVTMEIVENIKRSLSGKYIITIGK